MTDAEFHALRPGDLVCHAGDAQFFRVSRVDDGRIRVVRQCEFDLARPDDWELVLKASHRPLAGRVGRRHEANTGGGD